jgi:hypothetical protein
MATCARELPVRAGQAKPGLLAMIKLPDPPSVRGMAAGAFLAKTAFVDVSLRVTVVAPGRRILE